MADALDSQIAPLAAKQFGYVSREQLAALGFGRRAIEHRIATGLFIPVHRGVYALAHVNATPVARAAAAVLACGSGALLSHGSAATLWEFNKYWDMPYEVTAPAKRSRPGIKVHRSRALAGGDVDCQLGIAVTSPARTVLDIAPRLTDKRVSRVVNDGLRGPYLHLEDLVDVLERNPKHPGAKRLRRFGESPVRPTNSPLEDDYVEFARRYGLPAPVTNLHLLGYEVDVFYPRERVIVEVDSHEFHSDRDTFESDRNRDADFLAAGILTVRITDERMKQNPEHEASRLHRILEARRRAA